jgi:structural maintenance of chromosome 4
LLCVQEGEDFEVVPNSELVVTRTAHSDNSSNYYVNDRKSSFTKVTELLKHKGVDLDNNRFLILQVAPSRKLCHAGKS